MVCISDERYERLGPIYCWRCGERTWMWAMLDLTGTGYPHPVCPVCTRIQDE